MQANDLTAGLSYSELARIVEEHGEPYESLAQCNLFLRAAGMLRRRVPEETEHSGERMRTRDLLAMIEEARRARGVFLIAAQKPTVLVPCDDLR